MATWLGPFRRLRHPEYTGENRCVPCTILNVAIAAIVSGGVGVAVGGTQGVAAAVAVFCGCVVTIALRGYLVPGTPTLTRRYLPERVRAWFGKAPPRAPVTDIDVEATLVESDVLEECADRDDLCLVAEFGRAWYARMADAEPSEAGIDLSVFINDAEWGALDRSAITLEQRGAAYVASVGDRRIAQWESVAAFVADRAAAMLLADRVPGWDRLGFAARTELVGALRLWLTACPTCGTPVAPGRDTVDSCCREVPVVAVECERCDHRLFEVEFDPATAAAAG